MVQNVLFLVLIAVKFLKNYFFQIKHPENHSSAQPA